MQHNSICLQQTSHTDKDEESSAILGRVTARQGGLLTRQLFDSSLYKLSRPDKKKQSQPWHKTSAPCTDGLQPTAFRSELVQSKGGNRRRMLVVKPAMHQIKVYEQL